MQCQSGVYRVIRSAFNLSQCTQTAQDASVRPFLPQIRAVKNSSFFRLDLLEHHDKFGGQRDVSSFLGLRLLRFKPNETRIEIDLSQANADGSPNSPERFELGLALIRAPSGTARRRVAKPMMQTLNASSRGTAASFGSRLPRTADCGSTRVRVC